MVDEKLAKYGIEIAPLWQSHQFGLSFGYFCFEIRPKINALAIRIGKFLPKSGPRSVFYDVEKSLVELHLCYFKPMERAEEGNGKLFIEIRNIGVKSATTQHESYRPTKVGDSWREFVKVHLTEPVTANYGDEIDFFTVTNVEAEEDEIRWTLFFDSPAEFLRQSCIGCVQAAYRKGDTAKAIKILEDDIRKFHNLLKQAPDDGAIHYGLAVAYAMKLQSEDALNALKKALQLDKKYASKALDEEAFEFLRELEEFQRLL